MPPTAQPDIQKSQASEFMKDLDMTDDIDQDEEDKKKKELEEKNKQQDIDKDLNPNFKRQQKAKPDKDESLATLRKQRDDLAKIVDGFKESFGADVDPSTFKPLIQEIVSQADGPVTADYITKFIEDNKKKDETVKQMQERLSENEKKVVDLDIRHSEEYQRTYVQPYSDAAKEMFLDFAQVSSDEKVIAPIATKEFNDFLLNLTDIDGLKVKAKLNEFAKKFQAESGEDALLPAVSTLMASLRNYHTAKQNMHDAYNDWGNKKKESVQKFTAKQQEEFEKSQKTGRRVRVEESSKAFQEFDLDKYDFIPETELEEVFKEEFELGEKLSKGENLPPYRDLLTRGAKSRLFDKYAPMLKDLIKFKESVEKGNRNHIKGADDIFSKFKNSGKDDGDPEAFLNR